MFEGVAFFFEGFDGGLGGGVGGVGFFELGFELFDFGVFVDGEAGGGEGDGAKKSGEDGEPRGFFGLFGLLGGEHGLLSSEFGTLFGFDFGLGFGVSVAGFVGHFGDDGAVVIKHNFIISHYFLGLEMLAGWP